MGFSRVLESKKFKEADIRVGVIELLGGDGSTVLCEPELTHSSESIVKSLVTKKNDGDFEGQKLSSKNHACGKSLNPYLDCARLFRKLRGQ